MFGEGELVYPLMYMSLFTRGLGPDPQWGRPEHRTPVQ
jgi:hypothetical protein